MPSVPGSKPAWPPIGTRHMSSQAVLLRLNAVSRYFESGGGWLRPPSSIVRAVDDVSLEVRSGETLGIVGESGSGKTTLARLIVGLLSPSRGTMEFAGEPMNWDGRSGRRLRRDVQMVFQDSSGSLNPRWRVRDLVREPLDVFGLGTRRDRERSVSEMLERVGLDYRQGAKPAAQLSGGQRQRVGIARAVIMRPKLIVCDEPVSALDVSIRGQILDLLSELRRDLNLTYVFISHDMGVVERFVDSVTTMYLGRVVESAPSRPFFGQPLHPYAQALMSAVPTADPDVEAHRQRIVLVGEVPDPTQVPTGCRFHPRCALAQDVCRRDEPELREALPSQLARCHFAPDARLPSSVAPAVAQPAHASAR